MTKEQERAELHRVIWQIANDLRGSVDGWDFKFYVLGILFYRYISENITAYINKEQHKVGEADFDYAKLDDATAENARESIVQEKGFFILPSELFCNVKKNAKNDDDLNQSLSTVFKNIELSSQGTAAIVEFPSVLYRGRKEQKIRQYLIDNNFVDCVIQLPSNMFFGTPIATCIIVLKKSKKDNGVLFINATNEFIHSGNKNKLTDENIEKILNAYIERTDKDHFAKLVPNDEIGKNDYNISVSSYVEQEDLREVVDIKELNASLIEIVAKQNDLRAKIDAIVADLEGVA